MAELCCAFADCWAGGANVVGAPLLEGPPVPAAVSRPAGVVATEGDPVLPLAEALLLAV